MAARSTSQVLTLLVGTMAVSALVVLGGFYAIVLPLRAEDHRRELAALWVGTFDNEAQANAPENRALPEAKRAERQRYVVTRTQAPALGQEVLLLQLYTGDDLSTLYRQRLVRFKGNVLSGTVTQETYTVKSLPRGVAATPEQVRAVTPADLETMAPECAIRWERRENRRLREAQFVGTIAPGKCERTLRSGEKVYIESETRLDAKGLAHREAGARADRSYVFGGDTEADFYRFARVRETAGGAR